VQVICCATDDPWKKRAKRPGYPAIRAEANVDDLHVAAQVVQL
jgi:hypothetical protein